MTNIKDELKLIEELKALPNDEGFKRLQDMLGGINFFKLSGMGRQETKHSYFLLNLFDSNGAHGWGSDFAKEFLENSLNLGLPQSFYSGIKTARREYKFSKNKKRIDLLLYSNDSVVLIENKVDAALSENQLANYEEGINFDKQLSQHKKIYVFLTPDGRLPDNDHVRTWNPASYGQIIDSILRMKKKHTPKTRDEQEFNLLLNHYIKFLRNEVIKDMKTLDKETKMLYDSLTERFPEATAFLGMKRSDERLDCIYNAISAILTTEKNKRKLVLTKGQGSGIVKKGDNGRGRIQFGTEKMHKLLGLTTNEKNPFIYEISNELNSDKLQAYAFARSYDVQDPKIQKLFKACADYEKDNGRTPSDAKEGRRLYFKLEINIDDMFGKLQTDNSELVEIITEFLDEIQTVEEIIARFVEDEKKTVI